MVKQKASYLRAVEHDCGIHCSGRPLTLAFPTPTLQLRQITVLVPSTEMRLSDTLMEFMWLLRKFTWMQAGTCQTPPLSCVHSRMAWLKGTEGQSHEPGGRLVTWVLSPSSLLEGAAGWLLVWWGSMQHLRAFLLSALSPWSGLHWELQVNAGRSSITEGVCAAVFSHLLCAFGFVIRRWPFCCAGVLTEEVLLGVLQL